MPVDVTWDGVKLASGATARAEDGGWFVELEQPMPVGTRVTLAGDVQGELAVARVHEGVGAGMLLTKAGAKSAAPSAPVESAAAEPSEAPPEKEEGGGKKEKRKKKR